MTPECFEQAVMALRNFPTESERDAEGRRKIVGIIGGEPLLHPQFPELVDIMCDYVPNVYHRGLWTSKDWTTWEHPKWGLALEPVIKLIGDHRGLVGGVSDPAPNRGWLNWNMHLKSMSVHHQPLLVASKDVVIDDKKRWKLIEDCWLQQKWSSTVTPKGFFFCEVAGHFDMIFNGPGGLALEEDVWRGELYFETDEEGIRRPRGKFAEQVRNACENCGACVPMRGRLDSDEIDDVSVSNYEKLVQIDSPRVKRGDIEIHKTPPATDADWHPRIYARGGRPENQPAVARLEK